MTKVIFHGLPAWVGAIHGPTACDWWNRDPAQLAWNRNLLYTIDLANTPSAALAGRIRSSQIEVDDHRTNGGRTTLGPLWPQGESVGACWVADTHLARIGRTFASVPEGGNGHDYEYKVVHYFDNEHQNRRFHGFHVRVVQAQNLLSLVEIWHPGTGAGTARPAGAWWLDLSASTDPGTPPPALNQPGPLFLEASTANQLGLIETKLPPFKGAFTLAA
jgi:hypothetical protein